MFCMERNFLECEQTLGCFWELLKGVLVTPTLESRIIGGVEIIGGLDIVTIINNRWVGIIGGVGRGWKNSVGGFLVLTC